MVRCPLTLHRPDHNLLNEFDAAGMADGIGSLTEKGVGKAIVLDADGKVFRVAWILASTLRSGRFSDARRVHARCYRDGRSDAARPGVVNGPAIGGGAELIAYGELVVPRRTRARAAGNHYRSVPPLQSTMFPHIIRRNARWNLCDRRSHHGRAGAGSGLVNRLVPEAQLQTAVNELSARSRLSLAPCWAWPRKPLSAGMGLSLREALRNSMSIFLNDSTAWRIPRGLRAL